MHFYASGTKSLPINCWTGGGALVPRLIVSSLLDLNSTELLREHKKSARPKVHSTHPHTHTFLMDA